MTMRVEAVLRRHRVIVAAGLGVVTVLAWAWTLRAVGTLGDGMHGMVGEMHTAVLAPASWSPRHAAMIFLMWWIMMVAMMLPSAAPLALLVAGIQRRGTSHAGSLHAALMTGGYLAIWGVFSVGATMLQWGLEAAALIDAATLTVRSTLTAVILVGAGAYQLAPFKQGCLRHCRSPVDFMTRHWIAGALGAFRLGVRHGLFCVGCCGFLMALLFVGGMMNPFWIGAIALYVMLEKFAPHGDRLSLATGAALVIIGSLTLLWGF